MAAQVFAYIEHKDGVADDTALELISAAQKIYPDGSVTAIVTGSGADLDTVCNQLAASCAEVWRFDSEALAYPNAEIIRKLLVTVLPPDAVVLVATTKALKMHGGVAKDNLKGENVEAVTKGCENLGQHIRNIGQFGVPVTVAINEFITDTDAEHQAIRDYCAQFDVVCTVSSHWENGGAGATDLANQVVDMIETHQSQFRTLYDDDMDLLDKIRHIARTIYGADDIIADKKVRAQIADYQAQGYGAYPICMAKTQYSFSTDPSLMGAPTGHDVPIREVRLATGAEFIVVVCGEVMTMPGLPRKPASENISVDGDMQITGLF